MRLTKNLPLGLLILAVAVSSVPARADGDAWQDVWQEKQAAPATKASLDWQERALKRPEPPRPTAQRWINPQRVAQRPVIDQGVQAGDQNSMETIPLPNEPGTPIRANRSATVEGEEVIEAGTPQVVPQSVFGNNPTVRRRGCASCGQGGEATAMFDEGDPCAASPCDSCTPSEEPCDLGWEVFDGSCGPLLRGLSVFGGFDGFKGGLDRGGSNGNFGVNEGLNLARPLGDPWGCGYQVGANFVQSDFSGASVASADGLNLRAPFRKQYFATAAIFRRTECRGFQWGIAYDYLHDIYYQNANLQQIRSETGFVLNETYEIGYFGAYGVGSDKDRVVTVGRLAPTDMFALYVRQKFENGGDGRIWAGATGNGDGLLGADLWVPLGKGFALENRINYMIPKQGTGTDAQTRESWGLLIQLVWYPGQNAKCQQQNQYRPMFNVADNSLFMVDRLAR
jgi:hypothetical protein